MPNAKEQKKLEVIAKESLTFLKKIIASKGKLTGNYYYLGIANGKEAALVITLSAKDKTGMLAAGKGKALKSIFTNPLFSRGLVSFVSKKLVFSHVKGNARPTVIKKGFKETLSKESGMAFLKKAIFKSPDTAEEAVDPEETDLEVTAAELGLDAKTEALLEEDLKADIELQAFFSADQKVVRTAMKEQSELLEKSFLSPEIEEFELHEKQRAKNIEVIGARISVLQTQKEAAGDLSEEEEEELQQILTEYAILEAQGGSPFPREVGEVVTDCSLLVDGAFSTSVKELETAHQRSAEEIVTMWEQGKDLSPSERQVYAERIFSLLTAHYDATCKNYKHHKYFCQYPG